MKDPSRFPSTRFRAFPPFLTGPPLHQVDLSYRSTSNRAFKFFLSPSSRIDLSGHPPSIERPFSRPSIHAPKFCRLQGLRYHWRWSFLFLFFFREASRPFFDDTYQPDFFLKDHRRLPPPSSSPSRTAFSPSIKNGWFSLSSLSNVNNLTLGKFSVRGAFSPGLKR